MEVAGPDFDDAADPGGDNYDVRSQRSEAVSELTKTCRESEVDCSPALEANRETVDQWLDDEGWLLERYRSLISMTEYAEARPFQILAPLPSFSALREGQRVLMADAWKSASNADPAAVATALDRDLSYWRMVLRDSDVLITKMIATDAIIQHFKLGNIALRRLPQEVAADGIPSLWRRQITDDERSMKRSFAGEWVFFDESAKSMAGTNPFGDWTGLTDPTTWDRIAWVVLKPFWQPQDLTNQHARLMFDLGNAFDVPYDEIPNAVYVAKELQDSVRRPFGQLYNFTGNLLMSRGFWTFSDYAVRVSDLEGIRRAALLAAQLRANGVTKDDVVQRMLTSEIVDPYTNEPFTWLDGIGAVTFYGLESRDRAEHKLVY